jgi:hypothetical protein
MLFMASSTKQTAAAMTTALAPPEAIAVLYMIASLESGERARKKKLGVEGAAKRMRRKKKMC